MNALDRNRSFTAEQLAEFAASAISPEVLQRAGIFAIHDPKAVAKLLGRSPRDWHGHVPVWVAPYLRPSERDPVLFRGKPARPFEYTKPDGSRTTQKYVQPKGTGTELFLGPSLRESEVRQDVSTPLWITEGEKKCLSAESHGLSCIALPGVHQWHLKDERVLHPTFKHFALSGREVLIAFDADALTNRQVRKQELALGHELVKAGARVFIIRFPADAPKLDDFLAQHGLQALEELAASARIDAEIKVQDVALGAKGELSRSLRRDHRGAIVNDLDNHISILTRHPDWQGVLGYDERRNRQVFLRKPPFEDSGVGHGKLPYPLTDADVPRICTWLVKQPSFRFSRTPSAAKIEQAIAVACEQNRIDAVRAYLEAQVWDGVPRLDQGAEHYFGAPPSDYARAVFAKWMIGAVARVLEPGCQMDNMIVLEGSQGLRKSSALRVLAGPDHFTDSLPDVNSKDASEHVLGPWVIELAELDHVNRAELTALKAFLTRRVDSFRHAYGRRTSDHPRRCVFAGTTNESEYLRDATGNRRFWPLSCTKVDLDALTRDRDQLWAEGVHRFKAGEAWHIEDSPLALAVLDAQSDRRQRHPWEGPVLAYVTGRSFVTIADILKDVICLELGRQGQREQNQIAAILRAHGYNRVREGSGQRRWGYRPSHLVSVPSHTQTSGQTRKFESSLGPVLPSQSVPLEPSKIEVEGAVQPVWPNSVAEKTGTVWRAGTATPSSPSASLLTPPAGAPPSPDLVSVPLELQALAPATLKQLQSLILVPALQSAS